MTQPNLVLLIDDDKTFNFINERVIRMSTYASNIKAFINANKALEELRTTISIDPNGFPQVIFLDINMPVMDGWEFLEELGKFPENTLQQCKVYLLSSSIDEFDIQKSKSYAIVQDFISKPLTTDKLKELKDA